MIGLPVIEHARDAAGEASQDEPHDHKATAAGGPRNSVLLAGHCKRFLHQRIHAVFATRNQHVAAALADRLAGGHQRAICLQDYAHGHGLGDLCGLLLQLCSEIGHQTNAPTELQSAEFVVLQRLRIDDIEALAIGGLILIEADGEREGEIAVAQHGSSLLAEMRGRLTLVIPPPISRRQKWNFLVSFLEEVP